ncbi:MAG: DUF364 domain-containing protein, partial [Spirochaetota bacterium]
DNSDMPLTDMTALELAALCDDKNTEKASIGIAAINSLLKIDPEQHSDADGLKIISEMGKDKNISVIGHFPNVAALAKEAKNLWIIEKNPIEGDLPEEEGKKFIPKSDIVVITSTTLINKTLEGILELCRPDSVKMLLGPSTPLSDVIFDYGIDLLSGSVVTETETVLKSVSEGVSFRQLKKRGGIRFVTMVKDYNSIFSKLAE